jgi:hypothetical protein
MGWVRGDAVCACDWLCGSPAKTNPCERPPRHLWLHHSMSGSLNMQKKAADVCAMGA